MVILTYDQNLMINTDYILSYAINPAKTSEVNGTETHEGGGNSNHNFAIYATPQKDSNEIVLFQGTEAECKDVFDYLIVALAQGQRVFDVSNYQIPKMI
jgi:hypothetical protein